MLNKYTAILGSLSLLATAAVQAEGSSFQTIDADANGYISQEEAQSNADLTARWNELDTDKNNLLDMSEFSAFEVQGDSMEGSAPSAPTQ